MKPSAMIPLFLALASGFAYAGGSTGVGGGGDIVVLPNGDVVLADPFLDHGAPQPNNMPPLRALNPRILKATDAYLKAASSAIRSLAPDESVILTLLTPLSTRDNELRFYAVRNEAELNDFCAPGGSKPYQLPAGYNVKRVACTAGNETFLVEPLFLRLSLRDQSLLLMHERLTTLRDQYGGKNYSAIARFTAGLGEFLRIYEEQAKGAYRLLSKSEVSLLTEFFMAVQELEYMNKTPGEDTFEWQAHPFGGGRIHRKAIVDPSALVSLRSALGPNARVEAGARIENFTAVSGRLRVGARVVLDDVSLINVDLDAGDSSTISHTRISFPAKDYFSVIRLGERAKVENSEIEGSHLNVGADSSLRELRLTRVDLKGESNVDLGGSVLSRVRVAAGKASVMSATSVLCDDKLGSYCDLGLGEQAAVRNSRIENVSVALGAESRVIESHLQSEGKRHHSTMPPDGFGDFRFGQGTHIEKSEILVKSPLGLRDRQTLVNGIITDEAIRSYHPEGVTVGRLRFEERAKAEVIISEPKSNSKSEIELLCAAYPSDNVSMSCVVRKKKRKSGGEAYFYLSEFSIKVDEAPRKNEDPRLYVIADGEFKRAGFQRTAKFTFRDYDDAINEAVISLLRPHGGVANFGGRYAGSYFDVYVPFPY